MIWKTIQCDINYIVILFTFLPKSNNSIDGGVCNVSSTTESKRFLHKYTEWFSDKWRVLRINKIKYPPLKYSQVNPNWLIRIQFFIESQIEPIESDQCSQIFFSQTGQYGVLNGNYLIIINATCHSMILLLNGAELLFLVLFCKWLDEIYQAYFNIKIMTKLNHI